MEQMQMNMPDIYDAALYLRLSKDDMEEGGAKSESNSIANQRELLRSFVKSQPDIQIFDIYMWMTDTQEEILTDLSLNE